MGASLPVSLDAGHDLNAYYDRSELAFFHERSGGQVYTAESPDMVAHESDTPCWTRSGPSSGTPWPPTGGVSRGVRGHQRHPAALQLDSIRRAVLIEPTACSTGIRGCRAWRSSWVGDPPASSRRGRPRLPAQRGELLRLPRSADAAAARAGDAAVVGAALLRACVRGRTSSKRWRAWCLPPADQRRPARDRDPTRRCCSSTRSSRRRSRPTTSARSRRTCSNRITRASRGSISNR